MKQINTFFKEYMKSAAGKRLLKAQWDCLMSKHPMWDRLKDKSIENNSKTVLEEFAHNPQSPETLNVVASHTPEKEE